MKSALLSLFLGRCGATAVKCNKNSDCDGNERCGTLVWGTNFSSPLCISEQMCEKTIKMNEMNANYFCICLLYYSMRILL